MLCSTIPQLEQNIIYCGRLIMQQCRWFGGNAGCLMATPVTKTLLVCRLAVTCFFFLVLFILVLILVQLVLDSALSQRWNYRHYPSPTPPSALTILVMHTYPNICVIILHAPFHSNCKNTFFMELLTFALFGGPYFLSSPSMYFHYPRFTSEQL